ncbi:hypothetical protein T07_12194 [Trichinella nelsoni]|uniref:Uncharacterized protein n=1 Tax=Trichinella nelsoni TaxID=6336 RepID=A0A0V0RAS7_9BILA|nr:hypothetical protein T07_12194 [Trichinella nelsoni]
MEMYRTANPGMTVRPRPWPLGKSTDNILELPNQRNAT